MYTYITEKITKKLLQITTVIGLMKDFTILLLGEAISFYRSSILRHPLQKVYYYFGTVNFLTSVLGIVSFHAGFGLVVTTYALFLRNKV